MTALTTAQLDELEVRARSMAIRHVGVPDGTLLRLLAIARAALAWSDAVRSFADEIDALYPGPITVGHEVKREALGGVVKARAVALEAALRGTP